MAFGDADPILGDIMCKWAVLAIFLRSVLPPSTSNNEGRGLLKVSAGLGKTLNIMQYSNIPTVNADRFNGLYLDICMIGNTHICYFPVGGHTVHTVFTEHHSAVSSSKTSNKQQNSFWFQSTLQYIILFFT